MSKRAWLVQVAGKNRNSPDDWITLPGVWRGLCQKLGSDYFWRIIDRSLTEMAPKSLTEAGRELVEFSTYARQTYGSAANVLQFRLLDQRSGETIPGEAYGV